MEGKNLVIERKNAEGNAERLKLFAADLVAAASRCHCDDRDTCRALQPNRPLAPSRSFLVPTVILLVSV